MSETKEKIVTKKRVLVDSHVRIEPGYVPYWAKISPEVYAKFLEDWAKEVMDFVRDHRHQDINSVYVEREMEDQCSECGWKWEPMRDDETGDTVCSSCGGLIAKAEGRQP